MNILQCATPGAAAVKNYGVKKAKGEFIWFIDADDSIDETAAMLTSAGFQELVLEDQTQFEDFLEENRACWDYIDEELYDLIEKHLKHKKFRGFSIESIDLQLIAKPTKKRQIINL